jgi:hypothetical protein
MAKCGRVRSRQLASGSGISPSGSMGPRSTSPAIRTWLRRAADGASATNQVEGRAFRLFHEQRCRRFPLDIFFEYKGYDKQRRFYFVTYRLYNDAGFILVSADTGLIWFLDNVVWSPDRSRIASIGDSLNIAPFIVLHLSNGHAITEIFESTGTPAGRVILGRGLDQISWSDEQSIELSNQPDSPNRTDSRITLRLIGNSWKITSVEPEVPRFMYVYPER